VAAFTKAEIEAGMHPDANMNIVKTSWRVDDFLVGKVRLKACMKGEDPLGDMLTEEDMVAMEIIG